MQIVLSQAIANLNCICQRRVCYRESVFKSGYSVLSEFEPASSKSPKADVWFAQYHVLLVRHGGLNWSFTEFHSRIDRFFFTVLWPWKQAHRDGFEWTTWHAFFHCLPKLSSLTGTWTWSYIPLFEYLWLRQTSVLNYF